MEGVTDAAIWMSYPWADEPRNHGVVVGDNKENVEKGAKSLAEKFWGYRNDFEFVAPTVTLDQAIEKQKAIRSLSLLVIWVIIQQQVVQVM